MFHGRRLPERPGLPSVPRGLAPGPRIPYFSSGSRDDSHDAMTPRGPDHGPTFMTYLWLLALAAILVYFISRYNRLVTLRERFRNAFSQIDVQLRRRYDLIPNLVETAKGYLTHEKETLEAVIRARNEALAADKRAAADPGEPAAMMGLMAAEQTLTGHLGQFMALAEGYPELRGNETMLQLQEELASTENRIAFARQAYNDSVMRYNATRGAVPTNVVANAFRFGPAEFFQIEDDRERATPSVRFEG